MGGNQAMLRDRRLCGHRISQRMSQCLPVGASRCGPRRMRRVKASGSSPNPRAAISAAVSTAASILLPQLSMTSVHSENPGSPDIV